jgi:hypothetical protein
MMRDTTDSSWQRIDAAITRLEAAIAKPRPGNLPGLSAIEASNARLREAVGQTLRQIDALIDQHSAAGRS